jgi:hypothetical protein
MASGPKTKLFHIIAARLVNVRVTEAILLFARKNSLTSANRFPLNRLLLLPRNQFNLWLMVFASSSLSIINISLSYRRSH